MAILVWSFSPPAEPDHLTALLALYASLGEAAAQARRPATAQALTRSRQVLFAEHLWPWLPAYLDAVAELAVPALAAWAELSRRAIAAEFSAQPAWPRLPLALRAAPGDIGEGRRLVDALTTPVRSRALRSAPENRADDRALRTAKPSSCPH